MPPVWLLLLLWLRGAERAESQTCNIDTLQDDATHTTPDHSRLGNKDVYADSEAAAYTCSPGYSHRGRPPSYREVTCRAGTWQHAADTVKCLPVNCGHPGTVTNGQLDGAVFTFPNAVGVRCNVGYTPVGAAKLYCQSDGQWNPKKLPKCEPVQCPALSDPANGKLKSTDTKFEGIAHYECDTNYKVVGDAERHCEGQGTWSGTEPVCQEVKCNQPSKPAYGSVQGIETSVGSNVTFTCYFGTQEVSATRLPGGVWDRGGPQCPAPPALPAPPAPPSHLTPPPATPKQQPDDNNGGKDQGGRSLPDGWNAVKGNVLVLAVLLLWTAATLHLLLWMM